MSLKTGFTVVELNGMWNMRCLVLEQSIVNSVAEHVERVEQSARYKQCTVSQNRKPPNFWQ